MRRFIIWCGLLLKRLFRRPGYLAVLLAAPLLTLALLAATAEESGMVTVVLCRLDPGDETAKTVTERIRDERGVLRVSETEDPEEAVRAVRDGKADAAWIFGPLGEDLADFAREGWADGPVRVVQREDTTLLRLSREKLFAALFPELSYLEFADLLAARYGETDPEVLERYYNSGAVTEELIRFETLSGGETGEESYLIAPVRGLLALLVLLGGLASALYAVKEEREETFVWLGRAARLALPVGCHFLAALPVGAAAVAALALAGLAGDLGTEALLMLGYALAVALFCELVRRLLRTEERLAAAVPVVLLLCLALSPVFGDLRILEPVKRFLPTWWYLRAAALLIR